MCNECSGVRCEKEVGFIKEVEWMTPGGGGHRDWRCYFVVNDHQGP